MAIYFFKTRYFPKASGLCLKKFILFKNNLKNKTENGKKQR